MSINYVKMFSVDKTIKIIVKEAIIHKIYNITKINIEFYEYYIKHNIEVNLNKPYSCNWLSGVIKQSLGLIKRETIWDK